MKHILFVAVLFVTLSVHAQKEGVIEDTPDKLALSQQLLEKIAARAGNDPKKMQEIADKASKDPKYLEGLMDEDQKTMLRDISSEQEKKGKK